MTKQNQTSENQQFENKKSTENNSQKQQVNANSISFKSPTRIFGKITPAKIALAVAASSGAFAKAGKNSDSKTTNSLANSDQENRNQKEFELASAKDSLAIDFLGENNQAKSLKNLDLEAVQQQAKSNLASEKKSQNKQISNHNWKHNLADLILKILIRILQFMTYCYVSMLCLVTTIFLGRQFSISDNFGNKEKKLIDRLKESVANNDFASLKRLEVRNGKEKVAQAINKEDDFGFTVLHYAIANSNHLMLKALLDLGGDPNTKLKTIQDSLLHNISKGSGEIEMIDVLVQKGADVEAKDFNGRTPLNYAISKDRIDLVKRLKKFKASANSQDFNEDSVLSFAVFTSDNLELIEAVASGADLSIRNKQGFTALHYAAQTNKEEVIKLLNDLAQINLEDKDNDGKTPLHHTIENYSFKAAETLLSLGANAESKNNQGQTPFQNTIELTENEMNEEEKGNFLVLVEKMKSKIAKNTTPSTTTQNLFSRKMFEISSGQDLDEAAGMI